MNGFELIECGGCAPPILSSRIQSDRGDAVHNTPRNSPAEGLQHSVLGPVGVSLRWWLARRLIRRAFKLTAPEQSTQPAVTFAALIAKFQPLGTTRQVRGCNDQGARIGGDQRIAG